MATETMEPRPVTKQRQADTVLPWTVEARHPRNCDLYIQGLEGVRLRGCVRPTKQVFTRENGEQVTATAPAGLINGLPNEIPGMRLHVDPARGMYKVTDPLRDDEDMCDRIRRAMTKSQVTVSNKIRGMPPKEGRLDRDRIKTLVREMRWLVEADEARVVEGILPTEEAMNAMPGDYLTDPRGGSQWRQPRYERDMQAWVDGLNRVG